MHSEQRAQYGRYAEAYGELAIKHSEDTDDILISKISDLIGSWAADHDAKGHADAAAECRLTVADIAIGADGYFGDHAMERLFLARWGGCARPILMPVDVHWAAAMCATNVAEELVDLVRMPWRAFAIEVPPELKLTTGDEPVVFIGVNQLAGAPETEVFPGKTFASGERWVNILTWTDMPGWHMPGWRTCKLSELGTDLVAQDGDDPQFLRGMKLVGKLIIGCLMAMQSGQSVPCSEKSKSRRARNGKQPSKIEFVVGSPVHFRTVDFVRDFVRLGPRKMRGAQTIQTLVRGHWKNQPHGMGATERKFIHIEPYWRGPDDAAIAVRPHILKGAGV